MTLNKLIKQLQALQKTHGNKQVTVDVESFQHDDWTHVVVNDVEDLVIDRWDDKDVTRSVVVLKGDC